MIQHKIKSIKNLVRIINVRKKEGNKIVFCNGCFDILHVGHIKFLEDAKRQGDVLIVGINSDSSVKSNKGPKRPINKEKDRAFVLASIEFVDYVIIFSEKTPIKLINAIKPDIFVNGLEYGKDCIEAADVKKYGGKIHLVRDYYGVSTTKLINKIQA
ncbi:MAG: D-glycero-beta-D-manno-heptose 1-phosphate adenylyltransferase [Nanoarchaeota archaeon]